MSAAGQATASAEEEASARPAARTATNDSQGSPPERGPSLPSREPAAVPLAPAECPQFREPQRLYRLPYGPLSEVSGLAASAQPGLGVLWVHNDSGDEARLFAVDGRGIRGTVTLQGVRAIDFEELALVPGHHGPDELYVADTGDNGHRRDFVTIYRLPEPQWTPEAPPEAWQAVPESLEVRYEGGPDDVEGFLVDPLRGDIILLGKGRTGENQLYLLQDPLFDGETHIAARVGTLQLGLITAADVSRDGLRIVIRTYTAAWLWPRSPKQRLDEALAAPPCSLPLALEGQGEAIGFSPDGHAYYTLSEGVDQPLYHYMERLASDAR